MTNYHTKNASTKSTQIKFVLACYRWWSYAHWQHTFGKTMKRHISIHREAFTCSILFTVAGVIRIHIWAHKTLIMLFYRNQVFDINPVHKVTVNTYYFIDLNWVTTKGLLFLYQTIRVLTQYFEHQLIIPIANELHYDLRIF